MIDNSSFEQAMGVATLFASKGLTVVPVDSTPLAHLVGTTNLIGDLPPAQNDKEFVTEDTVSLSVASDNETHCGLYDDYVDTLSKGLALQINNARNVINPIINDAVEKIKTYIGNENNTTYSFELVLKELPEVVQNVSFLDEIKTNATGSLLAPRGRITIRGVTDVQAITEKLLTGSDIFDNTIKQWIESKGEGFILDTWQRIFASVHEGKYQNLPEIIDLFKDEQALDNALFVYLVSRKLIDDAPADAGMTLASWREVARDYISISSNVINREIAKYENAVANGNLVVRFDQPKRVVTVIGKVYRDYIATGGKNEIIFGAIVNGNIPFNINTVLQSPEASLKAWDNYSGINKTALKAKAFNSFKHACEYILNLQLNELTEFELEKFNQNPGFKETVSKAYREEIRTLCAEDMSNIYHTVMRLVCNGRFPYTDAYRFLDSMNDIARDNPEMDPREAASIATIEYISDHMADQMRLV